MKYHYRPDNYRCNNAGNERKRINKKLQEIRPKIKCMYMSGYTANVIAHHGVLDEGVNFIQKPFSIKAIAEKIRDVIDK